MQQCLIVLAAMPLVVGLVAPGWATAHAAAPPPQVTITAVEYAFDVPDQIDAGLVAVTFDNRGQQPHNLKIWQLRAGKTLDDVKAARSADALFALVAAAFGGLSMTFPGTSQQVVLDLPPGQFVLVSATRTSVDGEPDYAKGLLKLLTVVAPTSPLPVDEPTTDVAISLTDRGIGVPGQLGAGPHTIRLTNAGTQPHQLIILKLQPGKTPEDFATAFAANQTGSIVDPAGPNGGTAEFSPGQRGWITGTFTPGNYVAFDDFGGSTFRDVPFRFSIAVGGLRDQRSGRSSIPPPRL